MNKEKNVYMYIYMHTHIQQNIYSAIKKKEILLLATIQMDLKGIILSEISQKEKGKYHMISFIYMENETELKIQ